MRISAEKIRSAIEAAYQFAWWEYQNEAEFKHELFHRLALIPMNDTHLNEAEPGMITARLHAEAKVENGNPRKADLIICDPSRNNSGLFNYRVEQIFELKKRFKKTDLVVEIEKLDTYRMTYDAVWFVSAEHSVIETSQIPEKSDNANRLYFVSPSQNIEKQYSCEESSLGMEEALTIAKRAITDCLNLYGKNKKQYKSFFWCNYEHEIERHHSYPCEGDFNAHLYHRLRLGLPFGVNIRSEYSPPELSGKRIDLFLENQKEGWAIPIEIKMNWDQFKPKYKNGVTQQSEANTIINRFRMACSAAKAARAILVVIQGEWRIPRKEIKESTLALLENSDVAFDLVFFDEFVNQVKWTSAGGPKSAL